MTSSFRVTAEDLANHRQLSASDTVSQYTPLRINFYYDFTGQNVEPGDYFTFSFSPSLRALGPTRFTTNQGVIQINGNTGRFTFQGHGGSDANGYFYVTNQVNVTKTSTTVPIYVNVNETEKLRINANYAPNPEQGPTEVLSKYAMNNNLQKGNIQYAVRLNASGQASYSDAMVSDHLNTKGFTYDKTSFQIRQVKWTWNGSGWDNQTVRTLNLQPTFSADDTSFTIDFGNLIQPGTGYLILYDVLYKGQPVNQLSAADRPATGTVISNTVGLTGMNHQTITKTQTLVIVDYGGTGDFHNFKVTVTKTGADGERLANATFQFLQNGRMVATATTDANGQAVFSGLHYGHYVLHESQAPAGYNLAADRDVTIDAGSDHNLALTVQDRPQTTSATVRKVWQDADNRDGIRPTGIMVYLLANGKLAQAVLLNDANNWTATVSHLRRFDANGRAIRYVWEEANVPAGYTATVHGGVIINTHTPTTPVTPVTPVQPVQPSKPDQPNQPSPHDEPDQPNVPTTPTTPTTPTNPVTPVQPVQPSQPTSPQQPDQPNQPTPLTPTAQPAKPAALQKAAQPQQSPRLPQTGNQHDELALAALPAGYLADESDHDHYDFPAGGQSGHGPRQRQMGQSSQEG